VAASGVCTHEDMHALRQRDVGQDAKDSLRRDIVKQTVCD